ncbi:hypothetical protein IGB42_01808 [Andreprevotia sp. IGB-42]|uniref:hypothetical protein n=1 Tax=Andreprevotia sp. IGB-42 TaxID=2497473 RepID=UPI00135C57BD|nr:hypothetical protein [Andreprevotia sp. IGB-42]KAF0813457.1 hypothetical protein IGB42_01808 [Andreprevotia sp. IGB-42]
MSDEAYWVFFNFMVRRVLASLFIVVGLLLCIFNLPALMPGGTLLVDGSPSADLVMRLFAVFFPVLLCVLGIALFRCKPFRYDLPQ